MGNRGSKKRDISFIRKVEVNYEIEFISLTWRQSEYSTAVVNEIFSKKKKEQLAIKAHLSSLLGQGQQYT